MANIEFVKVIIWPITVIFLAVLFRAELIRVLSRLTHLKYKDFEFDMGLGQAEKKVAELEQKIPPVLSIAASEDEDVVRLRLLAKVSPRASILEAWIMIEEAAGESGFVQGADIPRINAPLYVDWLVRTGKLPSESNDLIRRLRNLKDQAAAHTSALTPALVISQEEAERYLALALKAKSLILDPNSAD